ncbi:hypothetical protein MTATph1_CDS0164 [Moorella phage MTATph1]
MLFIDYGVYVFFKVSASNEQCAQRVVEDFLGCLGPLVPKEIDCCTVEEVVEWD